LQYFRSYSNNNNNFQRVLQIYDNSLFRTRMFGLLLVYQVMAVISSILAYTYERRERVNKKIGWC